MSPIIFAHLEFLYRAKLFFFNWFCNGGQVEGRIFKNFMMQRIHRNFLAYYDVARQVPSDFWFFNLFRSTIKHFKVSQAVLSSTHFRAQWSPLSGHLFQGFHSRVFSCNLTYLQDGTLILHMLHLRQKDDNTDMFKCVSK